MATTSERVGEDGDIGLSAGGLERTLVEQEQHAGNGTQVLGVEESGKRAAPTLKQRGMKKYQIVVPESLFEEIEQIAASRQTTVIDIIRRFLKLGLLTAKIENNPNAALFIKEGDTEREIILL